MRMQCLAVLEHVLCALGVGSVPMSMCEGPMRAVAWVCVLPRSMRQWLGYSGSAMVATVAEVCL